MNNKKSNINFFEQNLSEKFKPYYSSRKERNKFAANVINDIGSKDILNLGGGGERFLKRNLQEHHKVFEVDFQGNNDLNLDLSLNKNLPFKNNQFDCVCAFDLLEHLETFHFLIKEMIRVSKKDVLISLPNSASEIPYVIFGRIPNENNKKKGVYSKYYGLPIEYQLDRHRWWIYLEDTIRFFRNLSEVNNFKINFFIQKPSLKKRILKTVISKRVFYNFFCDYIWIHISK